MISVVDGRLFHVLVDGAVVEVVTAMRRRTGVEVCPVLTRAIVEARARAVLGLPDDESRATS